MGAPAHTFLYDLAEHILRYESVADVHIDALRKRADMLIKTVATQRRREAGIANLERWLFSRQVIELLYVLDQTPPSTRIAGWIDKMFNSMAADMREAIAQIVAIDNVDQIIDGEVKEWSKDSTPQRAACNGRRHEDKTSFAN
jgi:hypothetical protein